MPKSAVTHDLVLSEADGSNAVGLMLARPRGDGRGWRVGHADVIPPRQLTEGAMRHSEFPPAIQLPVFETNWVLGIGGIRQQSGGGSRVSQLKDGDTVQSLHDGRIRLAHDYQATTVDTAPTAYRPTGFGAIGDELWAAIGRDLYQWSFTNDRWEKDSTPTAADIRYHNGTNYGTRLVMPAWTSTDNPSPYIHRTESGSWTVASGTGTEPEGAKFFAKARNASGVNEILWAAHILRADASIGTNIIVNTSDPSDTANWSGETAVGTEDSPIVNLIQGAANDILVFKTNGVWSVETDGAVINRTPTFEQSPHPDNFKAVFNWHGRILATTGPNGLVELTLADLSGNYIWRNISLENVLPEETEYHNPIVAITGNDQHVFLLVQDSSAVKYYLLLGDLVSFNGVADYRWHRVATITKQGIASGDEHAMFMEGLTVSSSTHHRLWTGITDASANGLPDFYPLSDTDDDFNYEASGTVEFVVYDFDLALVDKRLDGVFIDAINLTTARTILIEYRLDETTSWTTLATVFEDGPQTIDLPPDVQFKEIHFRLTLDIGSVGSTTPDVISFRPTAQLQPDPVQLFNVNAYLADGQRLLNGARSSAIAADRSQLKTWHTDKTDLRLDFEDDDPRIVVFVPGSFTETEIRRERNRRPEYVVTFQLFEIRQLTLAVWADASGDDVGEHEWDTFFWA